MARRSLFRTIAAGCALASAAVICSCEDLQPAGPTSSLEAGGHPPAPLGPRAPARAAFNPQAFAWSEGQGPGVLTGRVAYEARSGQRWACAGQTVALIPAVRYSGERMFALYGSDARAIVPAGLVQTRNAAQPGVDYGRWVRTAACDPHDAFRFNGLQPGTYFLVARARPHGHSPSPTEGVVIMQRVDIAPGSTRLVVPQP